MTDGAAPPQGGKSNKVGKIFVGGLARETTTNGLRAYFEQFGEISDCVVMKVRQTGAPRGFGFVTFASQADADLVVAQRHSVEGKEVEAKPAVPRDSEALQGGGMLPPQMLQPMLHHAVSLGRAARAAPVGQADPGTKKVFVGGLTHDTTEEEFMGYFGNFGPVSDCVIVCDPHTRKPRGFGFITFDSDKAVDRVYAAKFHDLNGKRVEVKRAIPPERIRVDERGPGGAHYGGYGRGRGRGVHPSAFAGNGAAVPFGPGMSGMPGMGGGMYVPGALGGTGGFHPLPPGPLGGVGPMSAAGLSSALGGAPPMLNTGGAVAEGSLGLPGNFVLSNAFINPGSNYGSASVALSAGLRAGPVSYKEPSLVGARHASPERDPSKPPRVGSSIEVEIVDEDDGETKWAPAEVVEVKRGGRFKARVNDDDEFVEEYGIEDEGSEWRMCAKYEGLKRQRKSVDHYRPESAQKGRPDAIDAMATKVGPFRMSEPERGGGGRSRRLSSGRRARRDDAESSTMDSEEECAAATHPPPPSQGVQ